MFGNLKNNKEALEASTDRIGRTLLETDIYPATIKMAYGGASKSGAAYVAITFAVEVDGRVQDHKETFYISNAKGETYCQVNGKYQNLPGFNHINQLAKLFCDKEVAELSAEERAIPLYNYEQKKEVPTTVNVITDFIDLECAVAIRKVRANKQAKDASGNYVDTPEDRTYNEVDKVFKVIGAVPHTFDEIKEGKPAQFAAAWVEKNQGQLIDKYKEVKGSGSTTKTKSLSFV